MTTCCEMEVADQTSPKQSTLNFKNIFFLEAGGCLDQPLKVEKWITLTSIQTRVIHLCFDLIFCYTKDECRGRCLRSWWIQPSQCNISVWHNHNNPVSGIYPGTVTLLFYLPKGGRSRVINRTPHTYEEHKKCKWPYINRTCLLYTSPSPRDATLSRMPSSA